MKPICFPEQTHEIAKDQDEYLTLPARVYESGLVVSCWQLTFKERVCLLFGGKLWLSILTFNQPLQPIYPTMKKEEVITGEE